ncbi:MAG: hypothetical protein ACR2P1_01010 [Pseudomonadales bacterium]
MQTYFDNAVDLPPKKSDLRKQIAELTDAYVQQGGEVHEIPRGISGRDGATGPLRPTTFQTGEPTRDATPLTEVVKTIEARRHAKPAKLKPVKPKPRRKLIYDDFGEPLRWTWVEE